MKKISLILVLVFVMLLPMEVEAAPKVKLSSSKKTVNVGKTVKITLKNNKKKVKWSVSNNKIKIVERTNKYVKVKAVKAGKAVLKAKVGKKTYKCQFVVKKVKKAKTDAGCGYYKDSYDNDMDLSYDGKTYKASICVVRLHWLDDMRGVKERNKIILEDCSKYPIGVVISVEIIEDGYAKLEVIESGKSYLQKGTKWTLKKQTSK